MHHHNHFLHLFKNKELDELCLSLALRSFSLSIIGIFVPIFLLQKGYVLKDIIIYSIILNFTHFLSTIPAAKFSSKFRFKHSILVSLPLLIMFYLMLYSIDKWSIYLIAIVYGFNNAFYYTGYHLDFANSSKKESRGKQIGVAKIFSAIFSAIGPLLGGFLLVQYSFNFVFIVVSFVLLISVLLLFMTKDKHIPFKINLKDFEHKTIVKDIAAYFAYGTETGVLSVFWPIFAYSFIKNFTQLGLLSSLALIFSMVFVMMIGKWSDFARDKVLKIGALLNTFVWFIGGFANSGFYIFIITSLKGISTTMIEIPFVAKSYDKAGKNPIEYIVFREMSIQLGRTLFMVLMLFILNLTTSFFIASFSSLAYLLF